MFLRTIPSTIPRALASRGLVCRSLSQRKVNWIWATQVSEQNLENKCFNLTPSRCLSFGATSKVYPSWLYRSFQTSRLLCDNIKIVETPPFAESVSEGDVRWDKVVGDAVAEDEVIGEVETDKTSIAITSPVSGVIVEFLVEDGSTVVAGQQLVKIEVTEGAGAKKPAAAPSPPTPKQDAEPAMDVTTPPPTTPPPIPPVPEGPMVVHAAPEIPAQPTQPPAAHVPAPTPAKPPTGPGGIPTRATGTRTEQRVKMSRMRQRIAERLKDAQNVNAMLTTFNEIDMSAVMSMRKKFKEEFQRKHGVKLGFMSAFLKASAHALTEMPVVNAVIDDLEIVYRDYIDISVAVATPKGLVVPVLRNVEAMNFADIERGLGELGQKASLGTLAIEDMDGGTFTVSNGGVFGSLYGTPIINPPQSAILGMHGIFDRPVAVNGKVEIRPMMYVALTYDHRLIDGREAVTFLRQIKSGVEDPYSILLEL
ncbi:hypothetical protein HOLleu_08581 [Holothuria leucospilota]|uniref:Dihydrolipoyllysine-residue succinyltransferase component of 2-oxoglutarate dehydrogenase complex, mitochondrial n=1 Tax=Holothuria leucospilota TaxID=206669 RepID=A0A9Q1CII4_HOLLE|nr:hypothetical protein HOLleu_08581 [Holothuria leucospilota]